jgi:hypothetical protein
VGSVTTSQLDAAVTSWLTAMRAVWPVVNTYVLKPFSDATDSANHAQITTSVNAFASSNSDSHLWSIDIGSEYTGCLPFVAGVTWCSQDGIHPLAVYHGAIGASVTQRILATQPPVILQPSGLRLLVLH